MLKDIEVIPKLISVVIPVYNGSKYLEEAILSILNQTYHNFELLIINDGSTDNSEEIIKSFKDKRIVYIKNEVNKGLIFTLNNGVLNSKGEFIARMDQDDISHPERFAKQIIEFNNDIDLTICGSFMKTFGNGKPIFINYLPITKAEIISSIYFTCPFVHPSVMIRKSNLLKLNEIYREDYINSEDYDLWSRLVFIGNCLNIPEYLLNYRVHEKQMSTVYQDSKYQTVSKIQSNLLSKINIVPSKKESEFMLNLFKGISRQDENYLFSGLAFLNKLHNKFKIQHQKYIKEHSKALLSRWFKICGNTGLGLLNIKLAFKLSFFKLKYLKFKDFIKLIYKTITGYNQLDKK